MKLYGKKPKLKSVTCVMCGRQVERVIAKNRQPTCSYRCRNTLINGKWAEHKDLVGPVPRRSRDASEAAAELPPKPRFASGRCDWCEAWFTMDLRITGAGVRFCSHRCGKAWHKAKRRASHGQFAIAPPIRQSIYERDGWTCQLCGNPVEPDLPASHPWAATLDHIECQSWSLVPDHSPANLRLAHRMCNSARGDRAA